jgi:hypothetical protein
MFTFIAGATRTGAVVAKYIVLRKSSLFRAIPRTTWRIIPQARDHPVPGKRSKRQRLNKPARRLSHHHVDFQGLPLQGAHQFRRLVRSNPARHAHRNSHDSIVDQWTVESEQATLNNRQQSDHTDPRHQTAQQAEQKSSGHCQLHFSAE